MGKDLARPINEYKTLMLLLLGICVVGCGSSGIRREEYSPLSSPQETYRFAKQAVAKDDPDAFYYCLSSRTRQLISLSEIKLGWTLASSFFYIFLDSRLKNSQIPAPEYVFNPNTAKLTLTSHGLDASFFLYNEEGKWHLVYPSPYPLPNISKIKKQQRLPWRMESFYCYRSVPHQWFNPKTIKRNVQEGSLSRKPKWRTE